MGQTRNLLNTLNALMALHQQGKDELITKYCANRHLEHHYRNQILIYDQKFVKDLRDMIDKHIQYLETKDPYGRKPLLGAEAKKNLFIAMRQELSTYSGEVFIKKLERQIDKLLSNPIIDEPRWPKLKLDNMYHFFKSIFSNPNSYLDKKPEDQPKSSKRR